MFERQTNDADRDRGDHEKPAQALRRGLDLSITDRREEATNDSTPISPVVDDQGNGGANVETNEKREVGRLTLRL